MERLNVAIVDNDPPILNTLGELINTKDGLSVTSKVDNGADAIDMIADATPDTVLLGLAMPKIDGMSVVEEVKSEHTFMKSPAFITLSAMGGGQMTEDTFKAGANHYLMKPFNKEILINKIRHIGKLPEKRTMGKVVAAPFEPGEKLHITRKEYMKEHPETDITEIPHKLEIPVHIKGYQYLRDAIAMSVEDQEMISSAAKILYPIIARRSQTTASRVERAIRHVVEAAWGRGKMETAGEVFGYTISTGKGKLADSRSAALVSDEILLEYEKI